MADSYEKRARERRRQQKRREKAERKKTRQAEESDTPAIISAEEAATGVSEAGHGEAESDTEA